MCGIFGVISPKNRNRELTTLLKTMGAALAHRGPDDEGIYLSPNSHDSFGSRVGLGHRRLSIIDLKGGHQPLANEDNRIWITYNGEIYNHLELRKGLEEKGHAYRTHSDTETIVHLYEEYGFDCLQYLRGMFSFCIFDEKSGRVFLARDRLGIKPLYYYHEGDMLIFASEIKAILASGNVQSRLNSSVLSEYFTFGYISSHQTLFEGVNKLLPGHAMLWKDGEIKIWKYWDLDLSKPPVSFNGVDYEQRFDELFQESVRLRLMSDVPLGIFLSGGIDSSAIAAIMSEMTSEKIKSFSVGFEGQYYSEFPYAREVSQFLGTDHYEVILTAHDLFNYLPKLIWHEDEPIKASPSVALYAVSQLASRHVKVVLTGEGSDELLGGYDKYWATLWNMKYGKYYQQFVPHGLRQFFKSLLKNGLFPLKLRKAASHTFINYSMDPESIFLENFFGILGPEWQRKLLAPEFLSAIQSFSPYQSSMDYWNSVPSNDILQCMLYTDLKTYLLELLMKQDSMSMATSIESRVPFLDHLLVEFLMRVPADYKIKGRKGKYLLKKIMQKKIPETILHRKKMGFPVPVGQWFRKDLRKSIEEILFDKETLQRGYFDASAVRQMYQEHCDGLQDHTERIWMLINFELWHRMFMK